MRAALRRGIAPAVVAVVFAGLGHRTPAVILALIAVAVVTLGLVAPGAAERLDRAIARFAVALATAVGWLALSVVWTLTVLPTWLVGRFARVDVLRPSGTGSTAGWAPRDGAADLTDRTFVEEQALGTPTQPRFGPLRLAPFAVGCAVLVLIVNYALGWTYDEVIGSHDTPDGSEEVWTTNPDYLAASPAMSDAPWAEAYFEEFAGLAYRYEPYVLTRVEDRDGPLITVTDGVRRTYEPPTSGGDLEEVWLFGGATVFGEGQRDEHTIASAFARRAEQEGTPVRVVNFGQPGHTTWQQWQFYERMVAERGAPAMAIFLGGYDDLRVQLEEPSPDPTHYNVAGADRALTGDRPPTDVGEAIEEYQEDSIITRFVRRLQGIIGTAHAAEADDAEPDETAVLAATYAADLHARAQVFLDHLAERDGTVVVMAWQPEPTVGPVAVPFEEMVARRSGDVVDLSQVLAERPGDFVDDSNVNEAAAAVVADELYDAVAPSLPGAG